MFDFAWSELGLVALVAVLVLGPKELPQAMRALGRFTRRARRLASEFQVHVNDLIREAELDDVKRSVDRFTRPNVSAELDRMIDPDGSVRRATTESPDSGDKIPKPSSEPSQSAGQEAGSETSREASR